MKHYEINEVSKLNGQKIVNDRSSFFTLIRTGVMKLASGTAERKKLKTQRQKTKGKERFSGFMMSSQIESKATSIHIVTKSSAN
jgi:hypothetical protein